MLNYAADIVRVHSIKRVNQDYLDIVISSDNIAKLAGPGQFVMIKSWRGLDPLLLRPFDIVEADKKNGTIRLIIKIIGKGTRLLEKVKPDDQIWLVGPSGKKVDDFTGSTIGLLTRGVGAAAVVFLAKEAHSRGIKVYSFMSANTAERLVCKDDLAKYSTELEIATDDGSVGFHGNAIHLLDRFIETKEIKHLYTCGSRRFARHVKAMDKRGYTKGFVFLERVMACGIGHCHGCAVQRENSDEYFLLCQDGPVFPVSKVVLQ